MNKTDDSTAVLTVLRTSDAFKAEVKVSMSCTLNQLAGRKELRDMTKHHPVRFFHLGRELKNGGRSLSQLGIGRCRNFVLHAHCFFNNSQKPRAKKNVVVLDENKKQKKQRGVSSTNGGVIDLLDSDNDEDEDKQQVEIIETTSATAQRRKRRRRA